jgi:methyl-accepting chemotaxis protein
MKLKDVKEISSDGIRLITEFGSRGMTESLNKIKEIASTVQEITDSLEDPQMVSNIKSMRSTFEAVQDTGDRMKNVLEHVKETGIIDEAKNTARSVRNKTDSINSDQNLKELIILFKDTVRSVKSLANELRML